MTPSVHERFDDLLSKYIDNGKLSYLKVHSVLFCLFGRIWKVL